MAEPTNTAEITQTQVANQGMISTIGNTLEKFRKFSNEPAVQRSIPVMITLFVISGLISSLLSATTSSFCESFRPYFSNSFLIT